MSHFFDESSSTVENTIISKKTNKKKKNKSKPEYTIDNLPVDEKQKFSFISNYLKTNKNVSVEILDNLLRLDGLPRNLKNTLSKMKNKKTIKIDDNHVIVQDHEDENLDNSDKEDDDTALDRKISECMELGFKGVSVIDQVLKIQEQKDDNNAILEKLLKTKLSLLNQHLSSSTYFEYKETLKAYLKTCKELNKTTNALFYIKMLMKTKYDENDLVQFLSEIEDAKKIYFDFIFFSKSMVDKKKYHSDEGINQEKEIQIIDENKLDDEYKLIYYVRNDFQKAIEYFRDSKCEFNQKILREFCLKSFEENELHLTKEIIKKIEELDDHLENIAITLEIVGLVPLDKIKSKFVILEKNTLLLKSINRKMELMRAYFLKINFDYEGCCNIISDTMGVEVNDFLVPEKIC